MNFIILTTIIFFTNILLYLQYTLFFLYWISYFLAYIPYYLNVRKDIINYNIKTFLPDLSKKKIDHLNFEQYKFFILNILIGINQYIFKKSFTINNYTKKKLDLINKKSLIVLCHVGLYYDGYSFYKLISEKSFFCIYKGIHRFNINKKLITSQPDKINFLYLKKFFCIYLAIDQKSNDNTIVKFLGQNVKFNSKLINYSIKNNRDIFIYFNVLSQNYTIIPNIIKIETHNRSIDEVTQDISFKFTEIIKKYPDQYLWCHDRFNFKKK